MSLKNALYVSVLIALCAGCSPSSTSAPGDPTQVRAIVGAPAGAVVASVNGEQITEPMLQVYAQGRGLDPADPVARKRALDSLVENVLLAQDAAARGLTAKPEVQAELALVRLQQLSGRGLADLRANTRISDEQVKAYYDQEAARTGGVEIQLKHILFDDQASAMAAVERALAPGADFDALVAEYAASGAKQARDLGWANLTQLPPEMAEPAKNLPDGQVAPLPVQTGYGWHVFKREASRPFTPPSLEQVKDGARKQLTDQALAEQVKALRAKAKIEVPAVPQASQGS